MPFVFEFTADEGRNLVLTLLATLLGVLIAQLLAIWYDRARKRDDQTEAAKERRRQSGLALGVLANAVVENEKQLIAIRNELLADKAVLAALLNTDAWTYLEKDVRLSNHDVEMHSEVARFFMGCRAIQDILTATFDLGIRFTTERDQEVADRFEEAHRIMVGNGVKLTEGALLLGYQLIEKFRASPEFKEHAAEQVLTPAALEALKAAP